MAKKSQTSKATTSVTGQPRVNKSAAIREYLMAHKGAMPKETAAALKAKGIDVSPQMVSMVKAKRKVKKAQRRAKEAVAADDATAGAATNRAAGLDAALSLYKAAQGMQTSRNKIRGAFLLLVEILG